MTAKIYFHLIFEKSNDKWHIQPPFLIVEQGKLTVVFKQFNNFQHF